MYADRKGWPLESVTVRVEHGRIHAKDCEECETKSGRIDRVQLELELEGPLDTEQCEKLREIAEKCPVKRTLDLETLIETRAARR
jgi:putative redox protein